MSQISFGTMPIIPTGIRFGEKSVAFSGAQGAGDTFEKRPVLDSKHQKALGSLLAYVAGDNNLDGSSRAEFIQALSAAGVTPSVCALRDQVFRGSISGVQALLEETKLGADPKALSIAVKEAIQLAVYDTGEKKKTATIILTALLQQVRHVELNSNTILIGPDTIGGSEGVSLLKYAVKHWDLEVTQLLLRLGLDPNFKDDRASVDTPSLLRYAALHLKGEDREKMLALLKKSGAKEAEIAKA